VALWSLGEPYASEMAAGEVLGNDMSL